MWGIKKTLVITGANGLIGRILYQTLKSSYKLILIDNKIGEDPYNRYGLERKHIDTEIPNDAIHKIDLSAEKLKFTEALRCYQPACVIHLAGLLENHEPHLIQEKNQLIHSNTLASCAELNIPVIAMSSIMLMYGAAMRNAKIRQVLAGNTDQSFLEQERLSVDHALQNNEVNIKSFNPDNFEKNLAYIKSKEYLESLVRHYACQKPSVPMLTIRLGWVSIKNPLELEGKVEHSEITVCLAKEDLISAMQALVEAVLSNKLKGYHCYPLISEHPQRWISLNNIEHDLGWIPKIQIKARFCEEPAPFK